MTLPVNREGMMPSSDVGATDGARQKELILKYQDFELWGMRNSSLVQSHPEMPAVIAIHGGTFTSTYFDLPGASFLDRAARNGIPLLALDRPGYGRSTAIVNRADMIMANAERLNLAITALWEQKALSGSGIFLIGHSIGGAICVAIASLRPSWPLCGISISGIGLQSPPWTEKAWEGLPDTPFVEMPMSIKDDVMFGPGWTYDSSMLATLRRADAPVPRAELLDIVKGWPEQARDLAASVEVPVHYRQPEYDKLWITNSASVAEFGSAFRKSSSVDSDIFKSVGHCIDFHRLGAAFQLEKLAFALKCMTLN